MWHITEWERRQIYAWLRIGKQQSYIAAKLDRWKWTISKEISRNSINGEYRPAYAQKEYERRRSDINRWRRKLWNNTADIETLKHYLIAKRWSPDSISWRDKLSVCTQTIYTYIDEREPSLKQYLKYKRGYKKRWKIDARWARRWSYRLIEERSIAVDNRSRIGDMEIDTIHSWWTERKGWIVTIVDRRIKFLLWWKVNRRWAKEVWDVLIEKMKTLPKEKLFTITSDNGKEFYDFERVEARLKVPFYFANPYASYERGTNEQTNGMIRNFFPKWTNFSKVSEEEIQKVIEIINYKPRKSLNYLCAYEAFHGIRLIL